MAIKKITYDNKVGVIPKNIHVNEVWDDDMNEIKDAINTNADQVIQNTNDISNILTGSVVPDATALVKGKLQLTGDLGGTADYPTVPNKIDKLRWGYVEVVNNGSREIAINEDALDVSGSPITNYTINLPTVTEAKTVTIAFDCDITNLTIGAGGAIDYYPPRAKAFDTWSFTYEPTNNRWITDDYFTGDLGAQIESLPNKSTLGDTDLFAISDWSNSGLPKKVTGLNLHANYLKPKNDLLYATISELNTKEDKSREKTIYQTKFTSTSDLSVSGAFTIVGTGLKSPASGTFGTTYAVWLKQTVIDKDVTRAIVTVTDEESIFGLIRKPSVAVEAGTKASINGATNTITIYEGWDGSNTDPGVSVSATIPFSLVSGKQYLLELEKLSAGTKIFTITDISNQETISITSNNEVDSFSGSCWDAPGVSFESGDVTFNYLSFGSPYNQKPLVMISGDSFVEGNSLIDFGLGAYDKRWDYLIYSSLQNDAVISGRGGENAAGLLGRNDVDFFKPKYHLFLIGANDTDFSTWKTSYDAFIAKILTTGAIPVLATIAPRADRQAFINQANAYIKTLPYRVVNFAKAISLNNDEVTVNPAYYMADNVHPNIAGHLLMYNQVKIDFPSLFDKDYELHDLVIKGGLTITNLIDPGVRTVVVKNGILNSVEDGITGSGMVNFLPKYINRGIIFNSQFFDDGTNAGVGTPTPLTKFNIDKSRQNYASSTPTGGLLITDITQTQRAIELGTDTNNGIGYIQARNASSETWYNLALNPNGGDVRIGNLAGAGTRQVVADASGNLSATLDFAANVSQPEASRLSIARTNIIGWGDSLTAGAGGGGTTYLSTLNFLTKFNVTNNGVGGETSTQIKDRFLANTADFDKTVIIWAGRNNYTDPITVKADIATMVANLTHTRYLVISVLNGNGEGIGTSNYNTIIQLNNDLKAIYGKKYLDLRAYLVSLHNSTAQDLLDYANDIPPTSLRSDGIHLNTQGYTNVGEFFNKNLGVLFEKEGYLQSKDFKYYFENYSPLHSISDESFTGVKTATNTGTTQVNGINLVNNGTTSTAKSLNITNNGTGYGAYINNASTGYAIGGNNASSGRFLYFTNSSTGFGLYITNSSTGIGQYLNNTGAGQGIRADNASSGYGFYSNNTGVGAGAYFLNSSTGIANIFNSATASTGDLLQFQKNGVVKSYVNNLGEIHAQTPTAGTNTTQVATTAFVQSATRPYKVYTALISQTDTSAPTAVVLENTLGGTVVLSYVSVGTYDLTLTGGFNTNKTTVFLTKQYNSSSNIILSGSFLSTNTVRILTSNNTALQDAQLSGASIEIRVYPYNENLKK